VRKEVDLDEALEIANKWLINDPDQTTKVETEKLISDGDIQLIQRFTNCLVFGTAGMRGVRGAGPMRMNRVMVRVVATAIAQELLSDNERDEPPLVVVGYDARHKSQIFAQDTVRVLAAHGVSSLIFPRPAPTPVLAYTSLSKKAKAGIMVTASHNPAEDSGYKVYWEDGAQIVSPIDLKIAQRIDFKNPPSEEALADYEDANILKDDNGSIQKYVDFASSSVSPESKREIKQIYTPLHGVGKEVFVDVFQKAGFENPTVVKSQAEPDPDFPTVSFPNPEEEGALDLAIELAVEKNADLVLANDPDADRLAVVVNHKDNWCRLNGNEIGVLLAEHILSKGQGEDRLVVTTVVSSRLLSKIADFHKVKYAETLTGFKWIVRPGLEDKNSRFVFGYEEALGFALGDSVRDKDGITSALAFAELAAELKAEDKTVMDLLDELWNRHGVHKTALFTKRLDAETDISADFMSPWRTSPPERIGEFVVIESIDLLTPESGLPATDALVFNILNGRIVIRPSGTEPMVKAYVEVTESVINGDIRSAERSADHKIEDLLHGVSNLFHVEKN
jgi:phosphomannomutase|tara:strand:- start:86 stop:1774 length:1689 start_codon:yes stop_codon:yes gene_type:complete